MEPPSGESTTTECGVNYQLLAVMLLKQSNGEFMVAVNHNQLRTMASETVDLIDWSYPPPSWAVPPERLVHIRNHWSNVQPQHARQPHCLCGNSGYKCLRHCGITCPSNLPLPPPTHDTNEQGVRQESRPRGQLHDVGAVIGGHQYKSFECVTKTDSQFFNRLLVWMRQRAHP